MRVELVRATDVLPQLRAQWNWIQSSRAEFSSPFFSPLFTEAVSVVSDNIFVGILTSGKEMGFFPFELLSPRTGRPPGGRLCDYQAVISTPGLHWTITELLQSCGLDRYNYKRLLDQPQFREFHHARSRSAVIDLQKGFESYAVERRACGSEIVKKITVCRRKLECDHGPLRLELTSTDAQALNWLFACKSSQYRRTGFDDQFQIVPWLKDFLKNLHRTGNAEFGGMLSVLWAGERIVAAHFGLRSRHVLHYWFPCYEIELKTYSPGLVLLMDLAQNAAACGLSLIDLGRADALYKQRFMSRGIAIAEGVAVVNAPDLKEFEDNRANTSGINA